MSESSAPLPPSTFSAMTSQMAPKMYNAFTSPHRQNLLRFRNVLILTLNISALSPSPFHMLETCADIHSMSSRIFSLEPRLSHHNPRLGLVKVIRSNREFVQSEVHSVEATGSTRGISQLSK
ncbi:hypothetical protein PoB_007036700 [Plakobranchus ocellatus]|uniref:Uncharacterized protein n=1 Tax=Plakobranchus ocellatus TaxID=259542 RepID=A0AAV4DI01_9GAST|nr:hypothetical protein PoB_007036700 [Plakobranchus ocellatus]